MISSHFFVISHPNFGFTKYFWRGICYTSVSVAYLRQLLLVLSMQEITDITPIITDAITDRKGKKIAVVDLSGIDSASTEKLIICQGNSTSQVSAIADSIREKVRETADVKPYNYEGYRNCQWIVIDYGNIMVHVFLPEFRDFYRLEDLWNDAPVEYLPDLD